MDWIYPTFVLTKENSQSQQLLQQFTAMQKELEPLDDLLESVVKSAAIDEAKVNTKVDENQLLKVGLECTQHLHEQLSSITSFPLGVQVNLEKNNFVKLLESTLCVLDELKASLNQKDWQQAKLLVHYHLQPLLFLCSETCYFWEDIYPDPEKMALYYANEFIEHFRAPNFRQPEPQRTYAYQLSIVVVAFNHLDITRQCIEHLRKYTDFAQLQAELILVDNGSTDGTWDFFRSVSHEIPNVKVIRFKHNLRMQTFSIAHWLCDGRYFLLPNNDILVTKNWAENLLTCIKSDPKIAIAAPMTNNTVNYQYSIDRIKKHEGSYPPASGPQEFVEWANKHNVSRPELWCDRARIMPTVAIYDAEIVSKVGFGDPFFYSMLYWDDDFSLRVRKQGYRQILCEDTLCFHFGSVTVKSIISEKSDVISQQLEINPLILGNALFFKKHGQEAWLNDSTYNLALLKLMRYAISDVSQPKILSLEFGCGDTLLQFKNEMRQAGNKFELFNLTTEPEYMVDLSLSSPHVELGQGKLFKAVGQCFAGQQFDLIVLGVDAEVYNILFLVELIAAVKKRLAKQGKFVLQISNPWNIETLQDLLNFKLPFKQTMMLNPQLLQKILRQHFVGLQKINNKADNVDVKEFAQRHFNVDLGNVGHLYEALSITSYIFVATAP